MVPLSVLWSEKATDLPKLLLSTNGTGTGSVLDL